jgi:hypothetical protein
MQKLYFPHTSKSPEINFSPEEDVFYIRGISSPEDVRGIYYPVIEWLRSFIDSLEDGKSHYYSPDIPLKLQIDLAYFNSSSAKFLYDIFLELKRLTFLGIPVIVEWMFEEEDIDMKEAGSDIASLVEMEFTFVPKSM